MKDDKRKWPVCRKCRGRVEKVIYPDYICQYCKSKTIIDPSTKEGLALMLAWKTDECEQAAKPKEVVWKGDFFECFYSCECGFEYKPKIFTFRDNNFIFCPGCGGRIKEVRG